MLSEGVILAPFPVLIYRIWLWNQNHDVYLFLFSGRCDQGYAYKNFTCVGKYIVYFVSKKRSFYHSLLFIWLVCSFKILTSAWLILESVAMAVVWIIPAVFNVFVPKDGRSTRAEVFALVSWNYGVDGNGWRCRRVNVTYMWITTCDITTCKSYMTSPNVNYM